MNRFCSIALRGGALVLAAALAHPPATFGATVTLDSGVQVMLPDGYGEPTKQVQKTSSPEGEIETTNWVSRAPTGEAVVVTVSRMPGKILDAQKLIDGTSASLLKTLGATPETGAARPGELLFRSNAALFRARLLVEDDRVYQLLYVGRTDEQRGADAVARMFESFSLAE